KDPVLRRAWRDPRELVAFPKRDRDEAGATDVGIFGERGLLDETLSRRHHEVLSGAGVAERDERRDALSRLHRFEDVLDGCALRGPARVRQLEDLESEDAAAVGEDVQTIMRPSAQRLFDA